MTQNQIAHFNAQELRRHNMAAETELYRHQTQMEAYERRKNELTEISISEQMRSNRAQEKLKEQQNAINAASIAETLRHNKIAEELSNLATTSQANLNKALQTQSAATAASGYASAAASYASAELSREKAKTEVTVRGLNNANAGLSLNKTISEAYNQGYVLSQEKLNKARIVQTQVQTTREATNTLWESIHNALNLLMMGGATSR